MPYPLKTYIHDHLAGATLAIELLETLLTTPLDQPLRKFLMGLRAEVVEDRDQLETLAKATNLGESAVKEAAAWFSEKLGRVKIGAGGADAFEIFEAPGIHRARNSGKTPNVACTRDNFQCR